MRLYTDDQFAALGSRNSTPATLHQTRSVRRPWWRLGPCDVVVLRYFNLTAVRSSLHGAAQRGRIDPSEYDTIPLATGRVAVQRLTQEDRDEVQRVHTAMHRRRRL